MVYDKEKKNYTLSIFWNWAIYENRKKSEEENWRKLQFECLAGNQGQILDTKCARWGKWTHKTLYPILMLMKFTCVFFLSLFWYAFHVYYPPSVHGLGCNYWRRVFSFVMWSMEKKATPSSALGAEMLKVLYALPNWRHTHTHTHTNAKPYKI